MFRSLLSALKSRPSGTGARPVHNRPVSRLRLEALEDRAVPAVHTWTGGGEDNLWSNPNNWDGGVPTSNEPEVGGTRVELPGNTASVMDIVTLGIDFLTFMGDHTLTLDTPLDIALGIASLAGTNTITGSSITCNSVAVNAHSTLSIDSSMTENFSTSGFGVLSLRAPQNYSGTTRIVETTLEVPPGSSLINSPVVLEKGILVGGGTVAALSSTSGLGGQVSPGGGVRTQTLTLGNGDFSALTYQPTIAGANSDRINVIGTLDLTGAVLGVRAIQPPTAASYTLIDKGGTTPITGTFDGLPEGTALFFGSQAYTISYVGGTGNDVVLTRAGDLPAPSAPLPPAPAARSATQSPPPFFSGAQVLGNILVLSGVGVPDGVQFVPIPLGSFALFTDVTGDGAGDVALFLPSATLVIDGPSGQLMALGIDDNGDGARDLMIFDPDGTTTRFDGRTGLRIAF